MSALLRLAIAVSAAVGLAAAAHAAGLRLSSPDFEAGGRLDERHAYDAYGCTGDNRSPALAWSGAPEGTRSFALTLHDPDAPRSGGWWHWLVHGIPTAVQGLPRGASPDRLPAGAVETPTSFGAARYGGPCPPPGDAPHRYRFTLYALDAERLEVPADASPDVVAEALERHALATTRLTARYGR